MNKLPLRQVASALLIVIIVLTGCKKEDEQTSIMTMTTEKSGEIEIYLAGNGEVVIDWGDGSASETVTLSTPDENGELTGSNLYTHTFSGTVLRTIVIEGQNITHLNCSDLQLTIINVTKNTALTYLDCSNQYKLTTLDVTKNTALTILYCYGNQLTTLDVTNNTALTRLYCSSNLLTSLDVTNNTALKSLGCEYNQLTSLDVTENTALNFLGCSVNNLTTLDVTKNTALTFLFCSSNHLTSLDVTTNTALILLNCAANQLTAEGLNAMFGTLHDEYYSDKKISIGSNPGFYDCDRTIATYKDWKVE